MNHTMTTILAMVVNGRQDDWDLQLLHVELPYQDSVCVATGLAPSEVHNGRLSRLALTVFQLTGVAGQHSVPHDRLSYCDQATDRQHRANDDVRKHHALTVSRINRRNSAFADARRPAPKFAVRCATQLQPSARV